jgi:predicted nucleotide-binding protein
MTIHKPKVFISYSKEDSVFAQLIEQVLLRANIATWRYENQLKPGDEWRNEIDQQLMNADIVLVILTPDAYNSIYVTYEWGFGMGQGKKIIPLFHKETKVHPRLNVYHYQSFISSEDSNCEKLVSFIWQLQKEKEANDSQQKTMFSKAGFYKLTNSLEYEAICNGISEAKVNVNILDNFLCEDSDILKKVITDALRRNVKIRIVLLNPYTISGHHFARQRSKDLNKSDDFVFNAITSSIEAFKTIKSKNFSLRLFSCFPSIESYNFDDTYIMGSYLYGCQSKYTPHFWLNEQSRDPKSDLNYIQFIKDNFSSVFLHAEKVGSFKNS